LPTIYYSFIFWLYWLIALWLGLMLIALLWRDTDKGRKATAAMLLVPIILRIFLIK